MFIIILPIPLVMRLNMPTKKKVGVLAVFATGFWHVAPIMWLVRALILGSAVIASVVSLVYRVRLSYGADVDWNEGAFDAAS